MLRRLGFMMALASGVLTPLAGVADTPAAPPVPVVVFSVERFEVRGDNPLTPETTNATLAEFAGAHEGLEGLLAAADALEAALRTAGFSFHRVNLPAQTLSGGVVVLEVSEVPVSGVEVRGNEFSRTSTVLASVPSLDVGKAPDTRLLSRELLLANDHGSRRTNARFTIDPDTGGIKALLDVQERKPTSWFVSLANTGSPQNDELRLTGGYSHHNLWDADHAFTTSYTTSPRTPSQVSQWGVNYAVPLYGWNGLLRVFVTDSDVSSGQVSGFDISGAGRFLGVSYKHFFEPIGQYRHFLTGSLEDRKFIDDTEPFAAPIGVDVRSRPVTLRYDGSYRHTNGATSGYVSFSQNIASGTYNDTATYALRRVSAYPDWRTFKTGIRFSHVLPADWTLVGRVDIQFANQALIPGEQFGAGGARSVRGYDERVASGDSGGTASVEFWAPPWKYGIRLFGFADTGYVKNQAPQAGERGSEQLASLGFGARWTYDSTLSVEMDFARVMETVGRLQNVPGDVGTNSVGRTKLHFNLLYRF